MNQKFYRSDSWLNDTYEIGLYIEEISSVISHQNLAFSFKGDFGVDLGGDNAAVAHQLLDVTDIGSVVE